MVVKNGKRKECQGERPEARKPTTLYVRVTGYLEPKWGIKEKEQTFLGNVKIGFFKQYV